MREDIKIVPVSVEELRADCQGILVQEWATLSRIVFGEPPWDNEYHVSRLIFGIGIDLMREGAKAFQAIASSGRHIGHTLGYEIFRDPSGDPRRITLQEISGLDVMNHLFDRGRLFYVDTLAVHPGFRRRKQVTEEMGIGEQLTTKLIEHARSEGLGGVILRTHIRAEGARALYSKLGFQELLEHDVEYPERSYWFLRLK